MKRQELRRIIIDFVRLRYDEEGNVPSINAICNETGLSRSRIYQLFPRGQAGICQAAGVPSPLERIERTRSATVERVRKAMDRRLGEGGGGLGVYQGSEFVGTYSLTPEQMNRFYGILHLEPERVDIASIIDTWLDMDMELRREWNLTSVREIARAVDFARKVRKRRLKSGVYRFNFSTVTDVDGFLKHMMQLGWSKHEIPNYLTSLWNLGIPRTVDRETLQTLKELNSEARRTEQNLSNYIKRLREEVDELKITRASLRNKIKDMNSKMKELTEERERLRRLIRVNSADLVKLRDALKAQKRLFKEARAEIDKKIATYKAEVLKHFEDRFKELIEEKRRALREEERQLKAKISKYEKKLAEKAEEAKAAEQRLKKLAGEIESLQRQLEELKPMVNRYDEIADLKRQLAEKALLLSREFKTRVDEERLLAEKREEMKKEFEEQKRIINHMIEKASSLTHLFLFLSDPEAFPEDHFKELDDLVNELVVWRSFREPPEVLKDLPARSKELLKMVKAEIDRYLEED